LNDSEFAAIRERERLKRLEEQITDMLLSSLDYKRLAKEIDHECVLSPDRMAVVKILIGIREKQPDNKKLQKLINHYAIELDDGMMVLKP
jgi:hypothetical protein